MRFVSPTIMAAELERKLKDCEERLANSSEAEKPELDEERENYRQLLALAKSKTVLWQLSHVSKIARHGAPGPANLKRL